MSHFGTTDFLIEVEKGNVPGHSTVHKFGRNAAVETSLVSVSDGGIYQTPSGVVTLALISDDADDTAAGAGAQEVTLQYLDTNFVLQTGTIATNGTTESTETIAGVKRLVRAWVSASGTYATSTAGSQQGTITIRVASAGALWAMIPEIGTTGMGVGQSLIGAFTVPAGKTAYILSTNMTVDSKKEASLYFFKRENADDTTTPFSGTMRIQNIYTGVAGGLAFTHETVDSFPEKTDIGYMATAPTIADISVEFELLLVDN